MAGHYYDVATGTLVPPGTKGAYPSVTTILDVRNKPELTKWKIRVGLEEVDRRSKIAGDKGTAVHKAIEDFLNDGVFPEPDWEHGDYFAGFLNWLTAYSPTDLLTETFLVSEKYGYAGRTDLICMIAGELCIVDFKTSKRLNPGYGLQLRGYEQANFEMGNEHAKMVVVHLKNDTTRGFHHKEYDEDLKVLLAHKVIWDWEQKHNPTVPPWDGGKIVRN